MLITIPPNLSRFVTFVQVSGSEFILVLMTTTAALTIVFGLLASAVIVGLLCMRFQLRVRRDGSLPVVRVEAHELGLDSATSFGSAATLVQFSTQFCSKCPGTARLLKTETSELDGVTHVEVDLTDRVEIARAFNVLQTPTTLVLDGEGYVRARITGAPTTSVIREELARVGALPYAIERTEVAS